MGTLLVYLFGFNERGPDSEVINDYMVADLSKRWLCFGVQF